MVSASLLPPLETCPVFLVAVTQLRRVCGVSDKASRTQFSAEPPSVLGDFRDKLGH